MDKTTLINKLICTPFRQEVELQQVEHGAGYTTLRLRIREGKRFTVFDIDPRTAADWGRQLLEWAARHPQNEGNTATEFGQGEGPSAG